jgi:hypothetical protein
MAKNLSQRAKQLRQLDELIARYPSAAIHYVLRGEYRLKYGEFELAASDFRQAILLAQAELATSDWGYREQATIDRAERGLRMAQS